MPVPAAILELIDRFTEHRDTYRSPAYKEAQVRIEFLNPVFEALGWDVSNRQGHAEAYKEVISEDTLRVAGESKAPDYAFRIGGVRKFFVEAKKPSVSLESDAAPAYQLRRYAWSAKLPLSVLSDFEEWAIYDTRVRPAQGDKASTARIQYFTYEQLPDHWDFLVATFSKDAILKGSFDKYAETKKGKRGTTTVDEAFLEEIEEWRVALAKSLAIRNPGLEQRELNFAVQRTIDRITFLRICEDRGIEQYGRLGALVNGPHIYARLVELFHRADERYNSGLFHFRKEKDRNEAPDGLTLGLNVDDKVLKDILGSLYYPESPYEFAVLPADILGQVYERFLGKVIRLTAGHQAKVEEKPEVKKAGGVYYTPTYIVDYIVKQTVGELVKDKAPKQVSEIRVLDPACGSGSFLIGAYQYLLDWHRDWYESDEPAKHKKELRPGPKGGYRLTTGERKRILLNNIYGVDIDQQAVEVTKLSLLLKVLEGETEETLQFILEMSHERVLPDLGKNIKCGNSLIGPDFYDGKQIDALSEEENLRINMFDWRSEFAPIFKRAHSGFDAVVGNPPWIRSQTLPAVDREYFGTRYRTATGTFDIYVLFAERMVEVAERSARIGIILPNKFFTTDYGAGLRKLLANEKLVDHIVDFEDAQVFAGAGTYSCILVMHRTPAQDAAYFQAGTLVKSAAGAGAVPLFIRNQEPQPLTLPPDGSRWTVASGPLGRLLVRLQASLPILSTLEPHIFQGLKTSADGVYMMTVIKIVGDLAKVRSADGDFIEIEQNVLRPVVKGEDVRAYHVDRAQKLAILYPYEVSMAGKAMLLKQRELAERYPLAWRYLNKYREGLGARDAGKWRTREDWYAYARGQNIGTFIGPKFLVPYMAKELAAAWDETGDLFFVNISTGGYGVRFSNTELDHRFVLCLLNSRLLNSCIQQLTNRFRGGYFAINKQALERLPFPSLNLSRPSDRKLHDNAVGAAEEITELYRTQAPRQAPSPSHASEAIERRFQLLRKRADQIVNEIYGLTDSEIRALEEIGDYPPALE
jgi:hypothetical protein